MPTDNLFLSLYLRKSATILDASELLVFALDPGVGPPGRKDAEVDHALAELNRAVAQTMNAAPPTLRFSAGETADREPSLSLEEATSVAAADALVAQVLLAAAEAVGEVATPAGPAPLRKALDSARADFARLHPPPAAAVGFSSLTEPQLVSQSLEDAVSTFKQQAELAIRSILEDAEKRISGLLRAIADQKDKILDALGNIAQLFEVGQQAAGLIRKAWEKLRSALKSLQTIIDSLPLEDLRSHMSALLHGLDVRGGLEHVFQVPRLRAEIGALHVGASMQLGDVDADISKISALGQRFRRISANIGAVATTVGIIGGIVAPHFAGPLGALAVPAGYSLGIAALVVVGMDYTGCAVLHSVEGVGEILSSLRAHPIVAGANGVV